MTKLQPQRSHITTTAMMLGGLLFSLIIFVNVTAQVGTSTVRGTIVDPQGGAVSGATVTLTNAETNLARTQTTDQSGNYIFAAVPPGTYRVDAEASGFKKVTINEVRALVDTPSDINAQLEVGNVSEVVSVTSNTVDSLINTQDASLGNNFEAIQIEQLPLESRNVSQLLTLQPGVTRDGFVAGARSDQSNITLDGVDVNEQQTGVLSPVLRQTSDSVQEFRVTTTNANATQGRSSGAQVSLITKSGTNEFHGSLYHFHRNTVTTANDFFNNRAG